MTRQQEKCIHRFNDTYIGSGVTVMVCKHCGLKTERHCPHSFQTRIEHWYDRYTDTTHKAEILTCAACGMEDRRDIDENDGGKFRDSKYPGTGPVTHETV